MLIVDLATPTPTPSATAEEQVSVYSDLLGYNPVWFWLMAFIILGIIYITVFGIRHLNIVRRRLTAEEPGTGYPSEVDKTFLLVTQQRISIPEACQQVTMTLKNYLADHTELNAETMTLSELQATGAPPKLIESLQFAYPIMFGGRRVEDMEEFVNYMNASRAVLDGWWE